MCPCRLKIMLIMKIKTEWISLLGYNYRGMEQSLLEESIRTSDILMQTAIEQFPYYKAGCYVNRSYIYNLIWMSKYIPLLKEQIVAAIVNRLVEMDVNVVDSNKKKAKEKELFEMEGDEPDVVSDTLDYCMLEMLRWLEDERDPAMVILCNVFERIILPTHGTRHVQFLLLYTISISQQCADRVLNNLWIIAAGLHGLGPGALSTRKTAASHLAGLLARCVRVPNSRLIHYLKAMAEWCHSYITAMQESTTASDNTKYHGAFHFICHAIFYLVAFKNHHLFMSKESLLFVESLNLPRLVTCALNPLKTCPPQVVHAFSSVTRSHQVVYCQSIIEKNTRQTLSTVRLQYDEWFPYDPYTLPRSGKIIWPLCIEYKDFLKEGDDESQYSKMSKKMEDDDYLMMATSPKLSRPGFRTSESVFILSRK
ncbi:RNA polymerase I-specific transcription initiation factor RRN3 isoform X2 [Plodia interpunctella]|uniref:RNA polymerase I-specific transcription initiation factor RRN3 isoform X2 n=1 Tax=Plodia interpunctella TaxID=58824 RepID=UPI0023678863|nr:RNA polymerase I-specific transcription initiation factor RRN3 isoform X2 [Plodia interpunctella]